MRYFAFTAVLGISSLLSAADPQLLNLVMPDAQIVAGVNVAKAKTSPFGQFVLRQMPSDGEFEKFVSVSGFDPRRDLQEVLMASAAGHKNGLVVARGTFDPDKIAALATADGKHTVSSYGGAKLITSTDANAQQAFTILDSSLAAMGSLAAVKGAIDRRNTASPMSAQLAAKVAMYGAADAWTVSLIPLSGLAGAGPGGPTGSGPLEGILQGDLLKKVTETSGGITFNSPIQVTGELVADSVQDATALGDVIKFLASMVQTKGGTAGAVTLVQSLTIATSGNVLKLGLSIPEAQLEQLIESGIGSSKSPVHKKSSVRI